MNKEVNFEIAKLLKEKGFNIPTRSYRQKSAVIGSEKILPLVSVEEPYDWNNYSLEVPYYSMPTIAEVVMWLYETHGIWVYIKQGYKWEWYIETVANHPELKYNDGLEDSPTEAYEEAIIYTLENLIQGGNNEQQ